MEERGEFKSKERKNIGKSNDLRGERGILQKSLLYKWAAWASHDDNKKVWF